MKALAVDVTPSSSLVIQYIHGSLLCLLQLGVTPLADNDTRDRYLYEVQVCTGARKNAATDSNVSAAEARLGTSTFAV